MKTCRSKPRSHGETPPIKSGGLDAPSSVGKRARARSGVARCLTCLEEYDVEFIDGIPKFYDHGTKVPHRCKTP